MKPDDLADKTSHGRARPVAPRHPVVHRAHGVERVDDYAWLADPDDPDRERYLREEQVHYLTRTAHLAGLRATLESELVARTPADDVSVGWRRDGIDYVTRSHSGDEHDRLHRIDPRTGVEQLLFDPAAVGADEPDREIGPVEPSPDGALLAYGVDPDGDGAFRLRFRDLRTGRELPDEVARVSHGGAWSADGSTFFYTVPDAANRPHEVRRHLLGTPTDVDPVVLVEPDRRFALDVRRSRDGRWVMISSGSQDSGETFLIRADVPGELPRRVASRRPGVVYTVEPMAGGWDGAGADLLLIVSDDGAPECRLLTAEVPGRDGREPPWRPVAGLPGGSGERLVSAAVLAGHVLLEVRRDGEPFLRVLDRPVPGPPPSARPSSREIHPALPCGQLRVWHLDDPDAAHVVVVEENLVTAPAWVRVELATGARTVLKRTPLPGVDPTRYVTERLFATAPDGVQVPVTIAHRRDARRGRTAGLLLTGFGAYETCSWPRFDVGTLSLLDRGLVYAVAHVRGGGELGRSWWQAGRRQGKPRTFVDYVAVRDALVAAGWAGEVRGGARVVTRGAAAGGLLQGAVFSRAPRMWRAVVAEVPFVDVVTTMSDPQAALAAAEREEWGDPAHDPDDLTSMLAWSPYDNPPPPGRPALLVTGAVADRRVRVHEPAKWVARLRAGDDPAAPSELLLRVRFGAGGAGRVGAAGGVGGAGPPGRYARLRYEAEILSWVLGQLGFAGPPPSP